MIAGKGAQKDPHKNLNGECEYVDKNLFKKRVEDEKQPQLGT